MFEKALENAVSVHFAILTKINIINFKRSK